jgi:hypothetical protein
MSEGESVFSMDNFTVTSHQVPSAGNDNHAPSINTNYANGSRINTANFLAGPSIKASQEQVIVYSHDKSGLQSQSIYIRGKLDIVVEKDELYFNKEKYDHQVKGPYVEKHHQWTREEYNRYTSIIFNDHVKYTEHKGSTLANLLNKSDIVKDHHHSEYKKGRSTIVTGEDRTTIRGERVSMVARDTKWVALDLSFTLAKGALAYLETSAKALTATAEGIDLNPYLAKLLPYGFLARTGVLDLMASMAPIGTIRV